MTVDSGTVTHQCWCGNFEFLVRVSFDDYEIATYSLDMFCTDCGAKHRSPTELDRPVE